MTAEEILKQHTCLEWLKEDYPNNWNTILDAMEVYADEKTKDMYPKEFIAWLLRTGQRMFYIGLASDIGDLKFLSLDGSERELTIDEMFEFWKNNEKNGAEENSRKTDA